MYYINVTVNPHFRTLVVSQVWIKKLVTKIIDYFELEPNTEIDIHITTNSVIKKLNKIYRGSDNYTDVLSFNMLPQTGMDGRNKFILPPDGLVQLGVIVISYEFAKNEAKRNKITVRHEITILLIHGILHLLGYDHEHPADRRRMQYREDVILSSLHS